MCLIFIDTHRARTSEALPPADPWKFGDGRPKGAKNRIQTELRSQFEQYFEHYGSSVNPLILLAEIARDPQVSPATREKAAHDLAKYLVPAQIMTQKEPEDAGTSSTVVIEALKTLLNPAPPKLIDASSEETAQ